MSKKPKSQLSGEGPNVIRMPESLDRGWVEQVKRPGKPSGDLVLDFLATKKMDSAGLGYIRMLHMLFERFGRKLVFRNITTEHLKALQSWPSSDPAASSDGGGSVFFRAGTAIIDVTSQITSALSVLVEMLYWGSFGILKKQDFKRGALGEQMYQLGFKAVGIVALLSFLIGVVLSLQTAMQLRTYGAGIFLAPLIGLTMVREMGPLLTAIILAGRTGSATTAEIATMGVSEEIDALKTMGINPIQFVVVPKFWAISLTMPLLSIIATTAGIMGGYFIAIFYLDLAPSLFFGELIKHIRFVDFRAGFVKSLVFSWLIVWIGSFYGLRVRGGAEAVGKETTESVVTGIFIIIIADALFSFIL